MRPASATFGFFAPPAILAAALCLSALCLSALCLTALCLTLLAEPSRAQTEGEDDEFYEPLEDERRPPGTKREIKRRFGPCAERYSELATVYRRFLDEVELLASEDEIHSFLCLTEDYRRDAFVTEFWKARDPYPETGRNEFREDWLERLATVRQMFDSVTDERSKYYVLNGPPGIRLPICSPQSSTQIEAWFYGFQEIWEVQEAVARGILRSGQIAILFHRYTKNTKWRVWLPGDRLANLGEVSATSGLGAGCSQQDLELAIGVIGLIQRIGGSMGYLYERMIARRLEPIEPASKEWVDTFASYSTDAPEGAPKLSAELELTYPGRKQSRTVAQIAIAVEASTATLGELLDRESYAFELIGEVLRDDQEGATKLFEPFRYRFEAKPEELHDGKISLVAQRYLRPGPYTLILRVDDLLGDAVWREERRLEVPFIEPGRPVAVDGALAEIYAEANRSVASGEAEIKIVPPFGELLSGYIRVETEVTGPIEEVRFSIDDEILLTKRRPPFSVDLDLGELPTSRELRATAFDASGAEVASDSLLVNGSPHRFGVRFVEPAPGRTHRRSVRVRASVRVPEGRALERLEIYRNDDLVATLFHEPFALPVDLGASSGQLTVLRALGTLTDGSTAEDVVLLNASGQLDNVQVDFVELYTTVTRDLRPVQGLTREDFTVFEDGVEQEIVRFELAPDVPLSGAILVDVSASMEERLTRASAAAARFFDRIVTDQDQFSLVAFNDRPHVATTFTKDREEFAEGLLGLRAERGTALYDALIFSLHSMNGLAGQRVLLLLSDGKDEHSRFSFEQTLEYAQRAEAAVYTIGIALGEGDNASSGRRRGSKKKPPVRPKEVLRRLAAETGGLSFFVQSPDELDAIYDRIAAELRAKYLIAYQSSNESDEGEFRGIEVQVRGGGEARTLRGYFP